jgi:hypothetical protein
LLFEPSIAVGGGLSVDSPGDEDPGILDLIQSDVPCSQPIYDFWIENPPREYLPAPPAHDSDPFIATSQSTTPENASHCGRCHRCNPSIIPGRELRWVQVNPAPVATVGLLKFTTTEKEIILSELVQWRLDLWRTDWRDDWPAYGPKSLVSDVDICKIANNAGSIQAENDLLCYANILHWHELSKPLFHAVQAALVLVHGDRAETHGAVNVEMPIDENVQPTPVNMQRARVANMTVGRLQRNEVIMNF